MPGRPSRISAPDAFTDPISTNGASVRPLSITCTLKSHHACHHTFFVTVTAVVRPPSLRMRRATPCWLPGAPSTHDVHDIWSVDGVAPVDQNVRRVLPPLLVVGAAVTAAPPSSVMP